MIPNQACSAEIRYPLNDKDDRIIAALRAQVAPLRGKLDGPHARGMFDDVMEQTPDAAGMRYEEGAVGGVAVAAGVGALVAWLGRSVLPPWMGPAHAALLSVPLAVVAIVSDLLESVFKRRAVIKDSGGAVPGIGGIFDLSDSLILAAPVGYFLLGLP